MLKFVAFSCSVILQGTIVWFVAVQTGDKVSVIIVLLGVAFFQFIIALALDLV
jgi:hypothetical protein